MHWTKTFIPTLREVPQEAEIASHRLMLRAGLIRKLSSGLYTFLPLGLRALRKVEGIVREEMNRAGAVEINMPALQPREIWDQSGRYETVDVIYKFPDRQNKGLVLGPTHEEVITDLVSREINSYRQLPVTFYQIQIKFRDEMRPRFGLLRTKEFLMKDAYSFDAGWDDAENSYRLMYDAYTRIFRRCGLRAKPVKADTGAIGGTDSDEFMALADSGEDCLVECDTCQYGANVERAERAAETDASWPTDIRPLEEASTPGMRTVEEVSAFLNVKPRRLIKTLVYLADDKPVAALLCGDRDLNETRFARLLKVRTLTPADPETIARVTNAPVGFTGPVGLNLPTYADIGVSGCNGAVTGANKADTHLINVNMERDTGIREYHNIASVQEGDGCPNCKGKLRLKRCIEVGHTFKLGTKYSSSFNASYLDTNGKQQPIIMGCYGIGVTRTLQAIIEQNHDDRGIIWPAAVAPYPACILLLNPNDERSVRCCDELARSLETAGVADVLVDDRDERPGVKFKDADLVGLPARVVVSDRSLASGGVEVKLRSGGDARVVPVAEAVKEIVAMVSGSRSAENEPAAGERRAT